jgi:hypothetical protein
MFDYLDAHLYKKIAIMAYRRLGIQTAINGSIPPLVAKTVDT